MAIPVTPATTRLLHRRVRKVRADVAESLRHELPPIVNFDNLVDERLEGESCIDGSESVLFDFGRLAGASSAVMALMVAWFRYAHARGKVINFVNVPEGVMNIVEVSELTEVLPIEASAEATVDGP